MKLMINIIVTLIILISLKSNICLKEKFYNLVYKNNIPFAKINKWYKKNFNYALPFEEYMNEIPVFNEKLEYVSSEKYLNGVKIEPVTNEIFALDSGIVIFKGVKNNYGKTIIIQQENGMEVWYSNLEKIDIKIYDYVKKGDLLGSVNNSLVLVFTKDGEFVDYKKYI